MTGKKDNSGMSKLPDEKQELVRKLLQESPAETVVGFLELEVKKKCGLELIIIPNNTNTAIPNCLITPGDKILLFVSSKDTKCGRKQMLYWYFRTIYSQSFRTYPSLIDENGKINFDLEEPPMEEMDMNDPAMDMAKSLLKFLK